MVSFARVRKKQWTYASKVDTPDNNALAVGGKLLYRKVDVKIARLRFEIIHTADVVRNPGNQRTFINAVTGFGRSRRSWVGRWRSGIGEDTTTIKVVRASASGLSFCPEPVVAHVCIGLDNNIISLSRAKKHPGRVVRHDRNEIRGDDGQRMAVKRHANEVVYAWVYEAKAISLALLHLSPRVFAGPAWAHRSAVNQEVISRRRRLAHLQVVVRLKAELPSGLVIIVVNHIGSEILIVVGRCGSINNEGTKCTLSILRAEMRVIPGRPVLGCLESVGLCVSRTQWALCKTGNAILSTRLQLTHAMPMNASAIDAQVVLHSDLDGVTPAYRLSDVFHIVR
jgi:hypothetical protein